MSNSYATNGHIRFLTWPALVLLMACGSALADMTPAPDLATFQAMSYTTIIEDFESGWTTDTALASPITVKGNTYTTFAGPLWVSSPGYTNYDPVHNPTTSSILTATGDESFAVDFGAPSPAVGFDMYRNALGPTVIKATSVSDAEHTFVFATGIPSANEFFGLLSDEPIKRIEWTTAGGGQVNTGIDNIRTGTVVPTPSAALLGILGLSTAGARLRRRRA